MAEDEEKFNGGPDERATKNLDKYYSRVVDLNDQLKFATSLVKDRTTIEKQSLNLSSQLVNLVQKMKDGYSDTKEVQKDLAKFSGKSNELTKQAAVLSESLTKKEQQRVSFATNLHKGIENQKIVLAKMNDDKAKGLKIDGELQDKLLRKLSSQEKGLATNIKNMAVEERQLYVVNKIKKETDGIIKGLEVENKHQEKINKNMGLTGKLLKGMEKIPLVGQFVNSEKALKKMSEHAGEVDSKGKLVNGRWSTMKVGLKEVGKQIIDGMLDPLTLIIALVKAGIQFDKQITTLQTGMGITKDEATGLRNEMSIAAGASGDMAINSERMLKTFSMLQGQLGIAASFSTEMTKDATVLSEKVGLSDKATANFAKSSLVVGKSIDAQYKSSLGIIGSIRNQTGAMIPFKETLEKAGNITGQIRAQLGGSLEEITKAVGVAASLGMELEQVAAAGSSMLDFQSSIEAELEAELLTGKELNLEKARMLALTGDYAGLAKEIAKEAGSFTEFTKMNVLQQNALAKSFGMSSNEMSNMLMDQEMLNKTAEQARAAGNEDLAKRIEARDVEKEMGDAVAKLKGVFVDLVGGPVGQFLNLLTLALTPIGIMLEGLDKITKLFSENREEMTAMEAILGTIAGIFVAIKGSMMVIKTIQMAVNVAKGIGLAFDIASNKGAGKMKTKELSKLGRAVALTGAKIFGKMMMLGPILGPALGIAGVAAMVGTVYALSKRKAEKGGMIGGNRHSNGGTMIEAEQGEFIMSRSGVQSVGVDNLHAMNSGGGINNTKGKAQSGGNVVEAAPPPPPAQDMSLFTSAVVDAVSNTKPGVVIASPYGLNDANYQSRNNNFNTKFE